jgi:hypothetical protein
VSGAARKPRIFIGSSSERLDVAYALQELLEFDAEPTVWTQSVFRPSSYALVDLVNTARTYNFAVFVFASDDLLFLRGNRTDAVRDNVIFELGLFVGALGQANCFLVVPRGSELPHLPSDLLGMAALSYAADRSDGNLVAALGPACNRIRRAVHASPSRVDAEIAPPLRLRPEDYLATWENADLQSARKIVREWGVFDPYDERFAQVRPALERIFAFLESLADAVLSGRVDEEAVRIYFEQSVVSIWPKLATTLAPPNYVDEWWDPLPKLAILCKRWSADQAEQ